MITRERLKQEIDKVEDSYLDILFRIIRTFEEVPMTRIEDPIRTLPAASEEQLSAWHTFIDRTYGSLAADPIERGPQGAYEVRESLQ
jgi:hypothetical protein